MNERQYPDRNDWPLADTERDDLGVEWVAALYESYMADHDACDMAELYGVADAQGTGVTHDMALSAHHYAHTAEKVAERIETAVYYERMDPSRAFL